MAEWFLRVTGACFFNGDVDTFCKCFHVPHETETPDGTVRIESHSELRALFNAVVGHFNACGATRLERTCIAAEYLNADLLAATHISRLLQGDKLLQRPYRCFTIIKRFPDGWKIAHGSYVISDSPSHNAAILGLGPA
ncbi:hypothetical protein [Pseudaestuariivita atlantica]|uniref:SnoaL-like domain-containing protein n=1 Tax=Pseudaestuariivita atlantica TaxID=1317121 RepID=A0A0L1JKL1_9RHOB|nr:hypothetical protein [Pseudaestuariivita atlantica]KNG92262.1 hypothetical protein ATO11_18055 [Pseudaestuariivita atlantica]